MYIVIMIKYADVLKTVLVRNEKWVKYKNGMISMGKDISGGWNISLNLHKKIFYV